MKAYPGNPLLILPIDIYPVQEKDLAFLLKNRNTQKDVTCFICDDLIEPFPLAVEPSFLDAIEAAVRNKQYGLIRAIKTAKSALIPYSVGWKNLNTPEDLAGLVN